ncbi:uncharacterized protein LOC130962413 [Arachis stenosperma]|uniref:uncharacterized protein LOC130962413 n=1 Tax=Arachis stenosperma TaxID=217475 RepID=UPI0025AB67DD|nr:uncharacterized protein LOC130962413 [Arachis stenosperma]
MNADLLYSPSLCKAGHNSRTYLERPTGTEAEEEDIDEKEAREQEANLEETMETAHAAHVADEEDLTQNYPGSQPDENTVNDVSATTTAAPPNVATTPVAPSLVRPATNSEPAPPMATRPTAPTPIRRGRPTAVRDNPVLPRGRGSIARRGLTATSTTPLTSTQNGAAVPPSPAQPRVVRHAVGSKSHILPSPTSAAGPCSVSGSILQGLLVRSTL